MVSMQNYLLAVVSAAVFCAVVKRIVGNKGLHGNMIGLLTGLFMVITVISPWAKLRFDDLSVYFDGLEIEASRYVQDGESVAAIASSDIIKSQTQAYILNKAASLGLEVQVDVTLSNKDPWIPEAVTLTGTASPYLRQQLQSYIAQEIGIPEDMQTWK